MPPTRQRMTSEVSMPSPQRPQRVLLVPITLMRQLCATKRAMNSDTCSWRFPSSASRKVDAQDPAPPTEQASLRLRAFPGTSPQSQAVGVALLPCNHLGCGQSSCGRLQAWELKPGPPQHRLELAEYLRKAGRLARSRRRSRQWCSRSNWATSPSRTTVPSPYLAA